MRKANTAANNRSGNQNVAGKQNMNPKMQEAVLHLEEISPNSMHSEAGDVSFESKGIEQEYDQICLKVCLHPLHFVVKNLLSQHFKKNGGGSDQ